MCDTMAIVGRDGVLFAKNSDRDPNEAQLLDWQPRRTHAPGTRLLCTWIEIPQVEHTHAVLLSRPFWMWGAEMGTNEHGVTIGNEAVFTRERYNKLGLTGMDLLRLALERAQTAAEAVQTIVSLLEEFGQGGGCGLEHRSFTYHNSFIVADPKAAFVLETAGGYHAVEEIRGRRSISNGLTISGFAERHSDMIKTHFSACRTRRARTSELIERVEEPANLAGVLRDHGADGAAPSYAWTNGGLASACVHAGGLLAASQTTASWIAELRPGAIRHWATATAAPCTSVFKPVKVDEPLDLGPAPTDQAEGVSPWWRHERLHRIVMRDPARLSLGFAAERDALEQAWFDSPPEPATAFAEADALEARWTAELTALTVPDTRPGYVRRYWAKRNRWAGIDLSPPRTATMSDARVSIAANR